MPELIPDLPAGVVGVEATGKVEDTDYSDILAPAIEKVRAEHGKVRFLYVLGDDYDGYTLGAAWDDMKLGVRHPASYERVALVTGQDWMLHSVSVFAWMIPGDVKVFGTSELGVARKWIAA